MIDIQMAEDVQQLTEVVITALGTKQNAREVTYSNQTVDNEDLLTSPNKNALEALRGKTAGVKTLQAQAQWVLLLVSSYVAKRL